MMAPQEFGYAAAFLFGLFGSVHCMGMCGGISAAFSHTRPGGIQRVATDLGYHVGRVSSYAIAGAIAGSLGFVATRGAGASGSFSLRLALGILIVVVGLSLTGWVRTLKHAESFGMKLWQQIAPRLHHVRALSEPWRSLAFGAAWGWLPCGLVYSTLMGAAFMGSAWQGAWMMVCFGLGTVPALLATGIFATRLKRFTKQHRLRSAAGLLVAGMGIWIIVGTNHHSAATHPTAATASMGRSVPILSEDGAICRTKTVIDVN